MRERIFSIKYFVTLCLILSIFIAPGLYNRDITNDSVTHSFQYKSNEQISTGIESVEDPNLANGNIRIDTHQPITGVASNPFQGPYNEKELNSYNLSRTFDLFAASTLSNDPTSYISDMMYDDSGNLYVLGGLYYPDIDKASIAQFISNTGNEISIANVDYPGFILKFDKDFNLLYGSLLDESIAINDDSTYNSFVLDSVNNLYIMGQVGEIWSNNPDADVDLQILKLDSDFNIINYTTIGGVYYEGVGINKTISYVWENPNELRKFTVDDLLAVDSNDNIVLTGSTTSLGYNRSSGQINRSIGFPVVGDNGNPLWLPTTEAGWDTFVVKLDQNLNINWSRYFRNSGNVTTGALKIGSDDRIYIGGTMDSDNEFNFGTAYPYQVNTLNGNKDAFVAVFESNGTLHTSTLLGGSGTLGQEAIYAMEFDDLNHLIVGGETDSSDFPQVGGIGSINSWTNTSFIVYFDLNDWNITYSTRIINEDIAAIMEFVYNNNNLYFSGIMTYQPIPGYNFVDFPVIGPYADDSFTRSDSVHKVPFVGILNSTKNLIYSTYTDYDKDSGDLQRATNRAKLLLNETSGEFLLGLDGINLTLTIKSFRIIDNDLDGLSDHNEVNLYGSDPDLWDTDNDGLSDELEVHLHFTDPNNNDTDGDCMDDYWETQNGLNPIFQDANLDNDTDGLNSYEEYLAGTDPQTNDTDGDGLYDYEEIYIYLTNASSVDGDGDGLTDLEELLLGFDPNDADMDDDGLNDKYEYLTNYTNYLGYNETTNPKDADTDNDELNDGLEVALGLNPLLADTDGDGLSDMQEYLLFASDPINFDTDGDGLNDTEELVIYFTNVTQFDSDFDGLNDSAEIQFQTDPWDNDTDGDGLLDGEEVNTYGTNPNHADEDHDGLSDYFEVSYGSDPRSNDSDGDGLPDLWEFTMGLNSSFDEADLDLDGDGLTTIMEYYNNTHPKFADIDSDSLNDYYELMNGTDPFNNDTDGDTLLDGVEINIYGTNPLLKDTDADDLDDAYEIDNSFDPNDVDMDNDGLYDGLEVITYGSDPKNNDTDGDGLIDGHEVNIYRTNPIENDTDHDGLSDYLEVMTYGTDPNKKDTDDDGLMDGDEILISTNPNKKDTDADGLLDGHEVSINSNPLLNDTDIDGLLDGVEFLYGYNLTNPDTDGDGMTDGWEALFNLEVTINDASEDPDKDNLTNLQEFNLGTDPINSDSDGDGAKDGWEIDNDRNPLDPSDGDQESVDIVDNVQAGITENPLLALGGGLAFLFGLGIFSQSFLSWLTRRGK